MKEEIFTHYSDVKKYTQELIDIDIDIEKLIVPKNILDEAHIEYFEDLPLKESKDFHKNMGGGGVWKHIFGIKKFFGGFDFGHPKYCKYKF